MINTEYTGTKITRPKTPKILRTLNTKHTRKCRRVMKSISKLTLMTHGMLSLGMFLKTGHGRIHHYGSNDGDLFN
jgi:hypothetical protein